MADDVDRPGRVATLSAVESRWDPLPVNVEVAHHSAQIAAAQCSGCRRVPILHALIAATAIDEQIPVVTQDNDHGAIRGSTSSLFDFTVGEGGAGSASVFPTPTSPRITRPKAAIDSMSRSRPDRASLAIGVERCCGRRTLCSKEYILAVTTTPLSEASLVADILARSGVGKSELCRRSGLSRSLLDSYLKGAKVPSLGQLRRIAAAAGVRVTVTLADDATVDRTRAAALLEQV
jgi:hypothetical protein